MLSIVHRQLAEEVEIELIDMKNENHNNDKHEQRNEFADRTYGVDHGSLLCPAQYHKSQSRMDPPMMAYMVLPPAK